MRMLCSQFVAASLCEAPVLRQNTGCDRIFLPRRPQGGGYSCGKERT
jgi:hypothetical protein